MLGLYGDNGKEDGNHWDCADDIGIKCGDYVRILGGPGAAGDRSQSSGRTARQTTSTAPRRVP